MGTFGTIGAFKKFRTLFNPSPLIDEALNYPDDMKYLIVGLGNIGAEYHNTRHNIGFDVIDALAKKFEVELKTEKLGDIAEFKFKGRLFILLKPSTYMNLSGKAVNYWMQKKKIKKEKAYLNLIKMRYSIFRITPNEII